MNVKRGERKNVPKPGRLFLDTNIYIVGTMAPDDPEGIILRWLIGETVIEDYPRPEVVISNELQAQIARVARRVRHKDWAGHVLSLVWRMRIVNVVVSEKEVEQVELAGTIPREDAGIYLAACEGKATCFVSENRKLLKAAVAQTNDFECLTPAEFVVRYLEE